MFVPEEKLERVEGMLEELWNVRKESVEVWKLARVAGVIGSFSLAMGNVARFHMQGMLSQITEVSRKFGWESKCWMEERVVGDIMFWRKNLRDLNGWNMREMEDVVYGKRGCVNMFSDASNVQVAGARIESKEVSWDTVIKVSLSGQRRKEW